MMPPNSTAILYNYWESEMLPFYCRARSLFWTCLIWSSFIPFLYGVTPQVPSATRPSPHSALFHSSPAPPHGPGLSSLTAGLLRHHTESPARQVCPPQLPVSAVHPYCLYPSSLSLYLARSLLLAYPHSWHHSAVPKLHFFFPVKPHPHHGLTFFTPLHIQFFI